MDNIHCPTCPNCGRGGCTEEHSPLVPRPIFHCNATRPYTEEEKELIRRTRYVKETVEKLLTSEYQVIVVQDTPDLWMQFYLGVFLLSKQVVLITKDDFVKFGGRITKEPTVVGTIELEKMEDATTDATGVKIKEIMDKYTAQKGNSPAS